MNKILIISIFLSSWSMAYAQDSSRDTIVELLKVSNAPAMIDQIYTQSSQIFRDIGIKLGISEDEKVIFDKYMNRVMHEIHTDYGWENIKEPMIKIYKQHYSEKELKDILAFFRTESGQSMLKKTPDVVADSITITSKMFESLMPKIQTHAYALKAEIEKHRSEQQ